MEPKCPSLRLNIVTTSPISPRPRRWATWVLTGIVEILLVCALLLAIPTVVPARPSAAGANGAYSVPLEPKPTVVRRFEPPQQRWQPGHRGVDLAAAPGASVLAAGDGIVRFAGMVGGKPTVSVAHDDGVITTYEPVRASVARGSRVRRGAVIGTVEAGHQGCSTVACLHWGARRGAGHDAVYLDPLGLLGAIRVRLKPVDDPST